jgi:hypothetical protein
LSNESPSLLADKRTLKDGASASVHEGVETQHSVCAVFKIAGCYSWDGLRYQVSQDGIVGIATGYVLDNRGVGVRVPVESMSSRPALGSTQPPIQWVPGAHSAGV